MNKISLTPTRDQLVNVGDRITYKNGYIELISIDADGVLRSRTWIAWMFVGDMNGRFIDKEYRL